MSDVIADANSEKVDRRLFAAALKGAGGNLKKVSIPPALSNRRSVDEWIDTIAADRGRSVEGIIAEGQHLREAKDQLDHHGEWLPLLKILKVGERYAQMLMKIADNKVLANPNHWFVLPRSWRTLHELSTLPREILEAKIGDGTITPEITRKEVAALKGKPAGTRNPRRRDLAESQKPMAAAKAATVRQCQLSKTDANQTETAARYYGAAWRLELEERVEELEAELEDARETARARKRENDRLQSEVAALRARVAELEGQEVSQPIIVPGAARDVEPLTAEEIQQYERMGQQRLPLWSGE
jgi:hypothetical protein